MTQHNTDTNPTRPTELDMRLRAEEPPIQPDDTPPSGTVVRQDIAARLRAEEPPITADDTNPSQILRPPGLTQTTPPPRGNSWLQLILAVGLIAGAVLLLAAAAYLWLAADNDHGISKTAEAEDAPIIQPDNELPDRAIEAMTATPTNTPEFVNQATPLPTTAPADSQTPLIMPTAAAAEIAAALDRPVAVEPPADIIVRNSAPFTIRSATRRTQIVNYTIQDGDTLDSIAAKFGLEDIYTLIWSNPKNKYTTLRPGTQLTILPEDGVYHEVSEPLTIAALAEKYHVTPYEIIDAEYNNLFGSLPETLLPPGMWIAVPGGEGERINFFAPVVQNTTSGAGAGVVSGTYNLWGCSANISGGSAPYGRPLEYYTWMQGFTPGGHEAVDLSANIGSPVYAAGAGTVAYAGWNNTGYGNVVVIAHGSTFSLYAHLNSYSVRCGQNVGAGSVIGAVGTTGNSSGPHLHFEIRDANWSAYNPQNYIGF